VAAAFHNRPWAQVVVLFPKGLVSPRQQRQLTCWGGNVHALAVRGTFDDCQRLVKEAFSDAELNQRLELSSANSINIGRLLPQTVYYAASSLAIWRQEGTAPGFVVPSGNLGNVVACLWARTMGLPIGPIELAHNANLTVPHYLVTGEWRPQASVATLASAMDVGNPSNMERLQNLHPDWRPHGYGRPDPRSRFRGLPLVWRELVPAYRDCSAGLCQPFQRAQARLALGAGRNRAPGQVQRDRRAADWRDRASSACARRVAANAESLR
jgi:hypothetical protein